MKFYGATFFVDPVSRFTVANEPDPNGVLHADGDLYVGTLPQSVTVSNTPVEWEGKRWTMLMWPYIPDDTNTRRVMRRLPTTASKSGLLTARAHPPCSHR